jgi:acyl-CoA thioesterase II
MSDETANFFLNDLLDVEPLEDTVFLGGYLPQSRGRVYGGQILGQAIMAATKTVSADKLIHSSHNYFVRPGDSTQPVQYQVFLDLDGRTFSNRRVVATQNGKLILSLTASFQQPEDGLAHQHQAPEFAGPEDLLNEQQLAEKYKHTLPENFYSFLVRDRPVELRPVDGKAHFLRIEPTLYQQAWIRVKEPIANNQALQRAVFAYITDLTLLSTCTRPHEVTWVDPDVATASIDHALWMHSSNIDVNEWLIFVMDTPWSGGARGLNRGSFYTQTGELVASVAQEGLLRVKQ